MNYKGTIVSGDLEENTVTIEMDKPIILKAGEYVVIPIEEFKQQIIDAVDETNRKWRSENAEVLLSGKQYYNEKFKNK
jgi:hypothetical protein